MRTTDSGILLELAPVPNGHWISMAAAFFAAVGIPDVLLEIGHFSLSRG